MGEYSVIARIDLTFRAGFPAVAAVVYAMLLSEANGGNLLTGPQLFFFFLQCAIAALLTVVAMLLFFNRGRWVLHKVLGSNGQSDPMRRSGFMPTDEIQLQLAAGGSFPSGPYVN